MRDWFGCAADCFFLICGVGLAAPLTAFSSYAGLVWLRQDLFFKWIVLLIVTFLSIFVKFLVIFINLMALFAECANCFDQAHYL